MAIRCLTNLKNLGIITAGIGMDGDSGFYPKWN